MLYHAIGHFLYSEIGKKIPKFYFILVDTNHNDAIIPCLHAGSFYVIGEFGNTHLYCGSMDAIETVAYPTFYCTFQGKSKPMSNTVP